MAVEYCCEGMKELRDEFHVHDFEGMLMCVFGEIRAITREIFYCPFCGAKL